MAHRIATLLCLAALACATESSPTGFEDAAHAARENARHDQRYRMHLREEYRAPLLDSVRECRLAHREAEIVVRIGAEGEPLETIANPPMPFADRVMEGIRKLTFLPPPRPDHWVRFSIPECPRGAGPAGCPQMVP